MFLITTVFQRARSKRNPDKPGKVYLRISKRDTAADGSIIRDTRNVSPNLVLPNQGSIEDVMDRLRPFVMMLCYIIERLAEKGEEVCLEEVVADFRKCIAGDKSMKKIITRSQSDFTVRADLVNLGNDLKRHFRFERPIKKDSNSFLNYIDIKSQQYIDRGQECTARSYTSVKNSLSKFIESDKLPFCSIDRDFVVRYSEWLKESGISESTQSFYLRNLRTIVNSAADEGLIDIKANLFQGLNTRVIFKRDAETQTVLNKETLKKIADADFSEDREAEIVRDMFMFGFYCRGMELMEILTLKKSYIKNGILKYRRRMKGNERVIPLDSAAYDILRKYMNPSRPYIFPLLDKYIGLQHYAIAHKVHATVKQIGKVVGFPALTFTMNISSWQSIMSQINASDILFGT